jgi:GT2 family glycosyltransferase
MIIYVIVVTYNGSKWIDKCFDSLVNSSVPVQILAIDNGSIDNTPNIIRQKFQQVEVIETGKNLGFGKANNIGFRQALEENADYVFLLNQDAWVEACTIEKLIKVHQNHPEFGILVPLQLNGDGNLIDSLFMEYTISKTRLLMTDYMINFDSIKDIYETQFANGACWLLPLTTLLTVGGFDPLFPHYGEDNDYINRIHRHNILVGICSKIKVFHDRESRKTKRNKRQSVNGLFVNLLIQFKMQNPKQPSKYYVLKYLQSIFCWIFLSNKFYYKCNLCALKKFISIYNKAYLHYNMEEHKGSHYL